MKMSDGERNGLVDCGVLLVDKPPGMTSHDVVARIRRHTGIRKVGHAGTLDPFATGLLLVMLGRATRLFDFFRPLPKEYVARMRFGYRSSTGDSDGELSTTGGAVDVDALKQALPRFRGSIRQRVPAYSAVKVGGEPLYRKARRGEQVEAPEREVDIHELELIAFDADEQQAELRIVCSGGTYIRALCEDIGAHLESGAYTDALRRTGIGDFSVGDAVGLEPALATPPAELLTPGGNPSFNSCFSALYFLPVRQISDNEAGAVANGRPIPGELSGPVRVAHRDELLAVYGPGKENDHMYPLVVFS